MSTVRTRSRKDSFKLQAGDDIVGFGISEGVVSSGIIGLTAGRQHNRADLQRDLFFPVIKEDRIGRTKFLTGFAFAANQIDALLGIQGIFKRNGLGILHVCRFALVKARLVFIGNFFGTFFGTDAAGDTFFHINVTRVLDQFDLKIACFAANTFDFRECQQFDIDVPADLDQFW